MKFPPGFENEQPTETELIRWLLEEDPNNRPTTMELLKSDLLPPSLVLPLFNLIFILWLFFPSNRWTWQEEEILKEALRTITIPGTTIFSLLIEKLFSLVPDEHLDYTYDSHSVRFSLLIELLRLIVATYIIFFYRLFVLWQSNKPCSTSELLLREEVFSRVSSIFKRHGAILLETPLLLPKVILTKPD